MGDTLDQHAFVLRADELPKDFFEGRANQKASAEAFRAAAARGTDLGAYLEDLIEGFRAHNNVTVMRPLAAAMALHHLNHGTETADGLLAVLERGGFFRPYTLRALAEIHQEGRRIDDVLPLLIDHKVDDDLVRLLAKVIEATPELLATVLELLKNHEAALIKVFESSHTEDASATVPALPALAAVLATSRRVRHREAALRAFKRAAEQGVDLSDWLAPLRAALEDARRNNQASAAYALTFHALLRAEPPAWDAVDALSAHRKAAVRGGVVSALGTALTSFDMRSDALTSRLLPGLDDRTTSVRALTSDFLERSALAGAPLRPEDEIPPKAPDTTCPVCRKIPSKGTGYRLSTAIEMMKGFRPMPSTEPDYIAGFVTQCSRCRDAYVYSHEVIEDVNSVDEYWSLERLSPTQALAHLKGRALTRYKASYDARIDRCRSELTHERPEARAEAAASLTHHLLSRNDLDALSTSLLAHPDPTIPLQTLTALKALFTTSTTPPDIAPLKPALQRLARSRTKDPRGPASWLLSHLCAIEDDSPAFTALLTHKNTHTSIGALEAAGHLALTAHPFARAHLPTLLARLEHRRKAIREAASLAVRRCLDQGWETRTILDTARALIFTGKKPLSEIGIDLLRAALDKKINISSALDALLEALETRRADWLTLETLRRVAQKGPDRLQLTAIGNGVTPYLPHVKNNSLHEALWILRIAIDEGIAPQGAVPALGRLCKTNKGRYTASGLLQKLAELGQDLTPALPGLTKIAFGDSRDSAQNDAARALVRHHLNNADHDAIHALLQHKDREARSTASDYLADLAPKEDTAPFINDLIASLAHPYWHARGAAVRALIACARTSKANAARIEADIGERDGEAYEEVRQAVLEMMKEP